MALRYTSSFDQSIGFSDTQFQLNIVADTALTVTLPGTSNDKYILTFGCSSDSEIYVGYGVTAVLPGSGVATTNAFIEFVVPGMQRYAIGGTTLSFITHDTTDYVGVSIRSITN
jgi:hypothetical protein